VCGSGFEVIDSEDLRSGGTLVGRVYLLQNTGTGDMCTTTLKTTDLGVKTDASAYISVEDGVQKIDDSNAAKYYAGPVTVDVSGQCVNWGGSVAGAIYDSPLEHCS
jgi:hypothetical protein